MKNIKRIVFCLFIIAILSINIYANSKGIKVNNNTLDKTKYVNVSNLVVDYPYKDSAVKATILGTPNNQYYKVKKAINPKVKRFKTEKDIPSIFKPWSNYDYGVFKQNKKAPLIIFISGTGSLYNSSLSLYLSNIFYDNGYNVLSFSSSTTMPYIVSQSKNAYGGYIKDESAQMYDLIVEAINREKEDGMEISDIYIGGFSLGGFQSILIHEKDTIDKKIGIKKTLALSTPKNIYTATSILDKYLIDNGIYDSYTLERYLNNKLSGIFNNNEFSLANLDMSNISQTLNVMNLTDNDLKILIGLGFRFYSANMTFTGEVFRGNSDNENYGRLNLKTIYKRFDSLTTEFLNGLEVTFDEYARDILYPYIRDKKDPNLTFDNMVKDFDLENSSEFIKRYNDDIIFIISVDDILVTDEDLDYFDKTFNNRVVLPYGGHTGILWHKDVVNIMLEKLKEK